MIKKQTAANNEYLIEAKATYNHKIYKRLVTEMNSGGNWACFKYLQPMNLPHAHPNLAKRWGVAARYTEATS
jgi:hypothetical protein